MTNEEIKQILLTLEVADIDFTVTQTGKESKKVNGLYRPATKEIILHNKNFKSDNSLIYTAIHEYTHHLIESDRKKKGLPSLNKSHNTQFWAKFDDLIDIATEKNIYIRKRSETLNLLIEEAKKLNKEIVELKCELGEILSKIHETAENEGERFEDIITHDLRKTRKSVRNEINLSHLNNIDGLSVDELDTVLIKVQQHKDISPVISELKSGKTINQTKYKTEDKKSENENQSDSQLEKLIKEKERLQKTIGQLKLRVVFVINSIESLKEGCK